MTEEEALEKYGHLLNNTGGNDPAELIERLKDGKLFSTNVVVYLMATEVRSQLNLLRRLHKEGLLK